MNKPVKFTPKVRFTGNKKALKKRIGFNLKSATGSQEEPGNDQQSTVNSQQLTVNSQPSVDTLLASEATDYNLSELARLIIRYRGFPGARDIQSDLKKVLQKWNHSEETLYEQTRKIHAKGEVYRKQKGAQEEDWL